MDNENVVRCRIGIGPHEDVTGFQKLTVMGMAVYGVEGEPGTKVVGVDRFGAQAPISSDMTIFERKITLQETMKFLIEFFDKFEDPLALQTMSNQVAREIMLGVDPTGNTTIMEAIRGKFRTGYRIREAL